LFKALEREENEIRQIGSDKGPPECFLSSVAHAPELAIGYLLRKEALRQGIALESEYQQVDMCFHQDGARISTFEIKGPWPVWEKTGSLKRDVRKVLAQSVEGVPPEQRYNAWILILEDTSTEPAAFVRKVLSGIADVVEFVQSEPISINGNATPSSSRHRFGSLRVVVFSTRKNNGWTERSSPTTATEPPR
jgi:hypothetical protein